jgi:hypothetical protein
MIQSADSNLVQINGDDFAVDYAFSAQPYFAFSEEDSMLSFHSSLDGSAWTTHATIASPFAPGEEITLVFQYISIGSYPTDVDLRIDSINLFSPFGEPEPELTEVYAATMNSTWNIGVPFLRHSTRHLHKSLFDYLEARLDDLKWTISGEVPFGCPPVIMQDVLPEEWDEESVLVPGTLALTIGDEARSLGQELGGPLAMIEVPFFVDVFMDTPGTTLALALDVRDILCGRTKNSTRYPTMYNYNMDPEVQAPGFSIEIEDVFRSNIKRNWEVVKFTAVMYFQDSEGN